MSGRDRREGWLRDLKPGNQVAVRRHGGLGFSRTSHYVTVVKRVTPCGRIVVRAGASEMVFSCFGSETGKSDWAAVLEPVTAEIVAAIKLDRLQGEVARYLDFRRVSRDKFAALSADELRRLLVVLEPLKGGQ